MSRPRLSERFYPGEIVSVPGTNVSGRVIELTRRSDGAPFLMIAITDGPRKGQREYPTLEWRVGHGSTEDRCEVCARSFRYTPPHAAGLPWCGHCRGEDQNLDPGRRSSSWELSNARRRPTEEGK